MTTIVDPRTGTPHYDEIATGFGEHNMDAPALAMLAFTSRDGQPQYLSPLGGTTLRVEIDAVTDTPVDGEPASFFINTGSGFVKGQLNRPSQRVRRGIPRPECGT